MKKRILAMLLAGALALSLAACGSGDGDDSANTTPNTNNEQNNSNENENNNTPENEPEFEGTKELVVGISADIGTWEPWGNFNIARQNEAPLVYQNLTADVVDLESNTMVHYYILAESTEKIGDLTYQIKIREGIYDSQGNPFTAEDAVFSFEKCKEVSRLTQIGIVDSLELVDTYTFNMTLIYDTVGTFDDICNAINMVTQEAYEASPDGMATEPIGTGPMVLDDYVSGDHATFKKADSYWNDAANESKSVEDGYCSMWDFTNLDVVRYDCITDTATMAVALETGSIDLARALGDDDVALFEDNDDFTVFGYPEGDYGVAFNVSDNAVTKNYNLRMAIALCLDSAKILDAVADGDGLVAKAWSYPSFVDYQSEWDSQDYFEYDLDAAKDYLQKYLDETGTKASDLKIRLLMQNEDIASATATAIQEAVGELTGNPLCVEILTYDRASFTEAKKTADAFDLLIQNGQIVTRTYSGYEWDAQANADKNGFDIFHSGDDKLQSLLMEAISVDTHSDETVAAYQAYLNEQCYIKNLFTTNQYGGAASWIGNLDHAAGAKDCLNVGALSYDWNASGK